MNPQTIDKHRHQYRLPLSASRRLESIHRSFLLRAGLAGAIAFEHALTSSAALLDRIDRVPAGAGSLVNVATDGESYGHHHKFGDLCLAYALEVEASARGFFVTNYGEYLDQYPPVVEVEISSGSAGGGLRGVVYMA